MSSRHSVIFLLNGVKVPCVRGTRVLRDVRGCGVSNTVPFHSIEERVTFKVTDSVTAQADLGITYQPVRMGTSL